MKRPDRLPPWRNKMRVAVLVVVMTTAFALGRLGVGTFTAGWLAASFGLIGVGLMVFWSRKRGYMSHCTACRYDALYSEDVLRRVPGEACTLCGDCLSNSRPGVSGSTFRG